MKLITFTASAMLALMLLTGVNGCKRISGCTDVAASNYNPNASIDNGSCQFGSSVVFYPDAPLTNNAAITVNGQTASATSYLSSTYPQCGDGGFANFTANVAKGAGQTFNFTGSSSGGTWGGSVTFSANTCTTILLPSGMVTFWTSNSLYNGAVVTINGISFTVSVLLNGAPNTYPTSGCANFGLPVGTYTYSIRTTTGVVTTGSLTVDDQVILTEAM